MARTIAEFGGKYLEWSSVVDAPVTYLMSREEFLTYLTEEYGRAGVLDFETRMARVDAQGTSSKLGTTKESLLSFNRAGPDESCITTEAAMGVAYTRPDIRVDGGL
jgi:hypothetical protein